VIRTMVRSRWFFIVLAALCLAPFAIAQDTLQYTGGGVNPGFGGYLVGPYNISINGTVVQAICDDIGTTIPGSNTWTAVRRDVTETGLVGARFYDGTAASVQRYFQVAYLAQQLLNETSSAVRGHIQWAIWDIMSPGDSLSGFSNSLRTTIQNYINQAATNATAAHGLGWSVYTPVGTPNSQEFLVRTPESAALLLLSFNALAVLGMIVFLRGRMVGPAR
jgi:hypothetical protein